MIDKRYLALSLCFWIGQLHAQIVNTGDVYISSNTQVGMEEDFINQSRSTLINQGEWFVYKDFENNGVVDFETKEQSIAKFLGDSVQLITGDSWAIFNDILFKNNSQDTAFYLKGAIDVYGQSIFEDGIVLNDNHGGKFLFEDNAEVVLVSDKSHVDGQVQKIGNSNFWYPIGDAGIYRPGGHSFTANNESKLAAKYWYANSNELFNHEKKEENIILINDREYWTVDNMSNHHEDVYITLSWNSKTTPKELITEPEALRIVYWSKDKNMWVDRGGVVDFENKTVTTLTTVKDFGVFTFARLGEPSETNTTEFAENTKDTTYLMGCDSILFDGNYYYTNQIFNNEIISNVGDTNTQTTIIEILESKYETISQEICKGELFQGIPILNDTVLIIQGEGKSLCHYKEYKLEVLKSNHISYVEKSSAILCEGVDVDLTVYGVNDPFWSTGEMQNSITVSESGEYKVKGKDENGCPIEVSTTVPPKLEFVPIVEGKDPSCFGDKDGYVVFKNFHQLNGEVYFSNNGGETFQKDPEFDGLFSGEYDMVIKDALGCEFENTVLLNRPEALELDILNTEGIGKLVVGQSIVLDLEVSRNQWEIDSIKWFGDVICDTCLQTIAQPQEDVTYTVVVYDTLGCKAEAEISLELVPDLDVAFPNIFSPNDDGKNDIFKPIITSDEDLLVEAFMIFDRWGEMMYKETNVYSTNNRIGWDGTYKGYGLKPAPFIYLLQIRTSDGRHKTFKGDVLLVK